MSAFVMAVSCESHAGDIPASAVAAAVGGGHLVARTSWEWIVEHAPLVFDTRNAARDVKQGREKVVRP